MVKIINSYLCNRKIIIDEETELSVYGGVPQGNVLGPLLRNVLYDDVLNLPWADGPTRIPFNLALMAKARDEETLFRIANIFLGANCSLNGGAKAGDSEAQDGGYTIDWKQKTGTN